MGSIPILMRQFGILVEWTNGEFHSINANNGDTMW